MQFDCPVGAQADLKELEYISAIHQTAKFVRKDGSITAKDIRRFLTSRYGIVVSEEEVSNIILGGLAGGSSNDDVLDLMEVAAILMIPYLLKAAYDIEEGSSSTSTSTFVAKPCVDQNDQNKDGDDNQFPSKKATTVSKTGPTLKAVSVKSNPNGSVTTTFKVEAEQQGEPIKRNGDENDVEKDHCARVQDVTKKDIIEQTKSNEQLSSIHRKDDAKQNERRESFQTTKSIPSRFSNAAPPSSNRDFSKGASQRFMKRRYRLDRKSQNDFSSKWEYENFKQKCHLSNELSPSDAVSVIEGVLNLILLDTVETAGREEVSVLLDNTDARASSSITTKNNCRSKTSSDQFLAASLLSSPPELTLELLQSIFEYYGEYEIANDEELLLSMIELTRPQHDQTVAGAVLDASAFMRGLTNDIKLYDVDSELSDNTFYYDVFGTEESTRTIGVAKSFWYSLHGLPPNSTSSSSGHSKKRELLPALSSQSNNKAEEGKVGSACATCVQIADATDETEDGMERGDLVPKKEWNDSSNNHVNSNECEGSNNDYYSITRINTCPSIDFFADTYRSRRIVVLLWIGYVVAYYCFFYERGGQELEPIQCPAPTDTDVYFGCILGRSIIRWLMVGATLSITGVLYVGLGSLGNNMLQTNIVPTLVAICSMVFFTILPFVYDLKICPIDTSHQQDRDSLANDIAYYSSLVVGCILIILQIGGILSFLCPRAILQMKTKLWELVRFVSSRHFIAGPASRESHFKRAASRKINQLVANAYDVHGIYEVGQEHETSHGRALLNFAKRGLQFKSLNFSWAWKSILTGTLEDHEGVWLSSRIVAGNLSQAISCVLFFTILVQAVVSFTSNNQPQPSCTIELCESDYGVDGAMCVDACREQAGNVTLAVETCVALSCLCGTCGANVFLKNSVVKAAVSVGGTIGLISVCFISLLYLPSYIFTTMKLRTGIIPTLLDDYFAFNYRLAVDLSTRIFGSMFWSLFATGAIITLFFGTLTGLFTWEITRPFMLWWLAGLLGVWISIIVKIFIMMSLRRKYFGAFYRKYPALANLLCLALECWNLGLAAGYVVTRILFLSLALMFYVGRIDVPLLDLNTKVLCINLDVYPVLFRQDILVHDAHRHPYIETLGSMYMMKLRYRHRFASRAGSTWRLLFTIVLMPWLRKYRIMSHPANDNKEDVGEHLSDDEIHDKESSTNDNIIDEHGNVRSLNVLKSSADQPQKGSLRTKDVQDSSAIMKAPKEGVAKRRSHSRSVMLKQGGSNLTLTNPRMRTSTRNAIDEGNNTTMLNAMMTMIEGTSTIGRRRSTIIPPYIMKDHQIREEVSFSDEVRRLQFENQKLKKELQRYKDQISNLSTSSPDLKS